jgi:predicted MPP superfamily phosphohydrolase
MKNRIRKIFFVLATLVILVDLISMRAINLFLEAPSPMTTTLITAIHWGISLIFLITLLLGAIATPNMKSVASSRRMFAFSGAFLLFYVPKLIFVAFNVVDELIFQTARFMSYKGDYLLILSWAGLALGVLAFLLILYGIFIGKTDLKVNKISIRSKSLPTSFDGLRLVHISDLHLGSIPSRSKYPEKIKEKINDLNPDLLLFTGDLINNTSEEAIPWIDTLKQMKAKKAKLSVCGNHDYGEYVDWSSEEEMLADQKNLRELQEKAGFRVLDNESYELTSNGDSIAVIGVENWGLPPFPQHGDLEKAMKEASEAQYHILLSHDPTHWGEEVLGKTRIGLTLSGHTHGFQFGFKFGKVKWSPVQFKYPRWMGLYQEGNQYLYVSRGLGYIGFPGRIGMSPEITEITLKRS